MKGWHTGLFHPQNPDKYIGVLSNIVYRSGWEFKFFRYCDRTPSIIRWGSEEFHIPYTSPVDGRRHRYFPDIFMEVRAKDGSTKKFVIEIKPKAQTRPPVQARRPKKRVLAEAATYAINQAKWRAAEAYCQQRGWQFMVFTEDHLGV